MNTTMKEIVRVRNEEVRKLKQTNLGPEEESFVLVYDFLPAYSASLYVL